MYGLGSGVYAEYAVLGESAFSKPENITFEEAATLGIATSTSIVALFYDETGLGLSPPSHAKPYLHPEYILIWGGSSSCGGNVSTLV